MKYFIIGLLIGSLGLLSMNSYSMDLYQSEQLRLLQEISNGINNNGIDNAPQINTGEFYNKPLTKADRKRIHERICKEQIEQRNKGMHVYVLSTCE